MSEEQLKAFIAEVKYDPSLQDQLKAEGADPVAVAQAAGFEVTKEDYLRRMKSMNEVSDQELEGSSGGRASDTAKCGGTCYIPTPWGCIL